MKVVSAFLPPLMPGLQDSNPQARKALEEGSDRASGSRRTLPGVAPDDSHSKAQHGGQKNNSALGDATADGEEKSSAGKEKQQDSSSQQRGYNERGSPFELSEAEMRIVMDLRNRDREVRAHEQAHKSAAGQHARGGVNFEFTRGPDGQKYATGGHVNIDTSPIAGDPKATIEKAQTIIRAAMAPAEPSPQDRRVAAEASAMRNDAQKEMRELAAAEMQQRQEESKIAIEETDDTQAASVEDPSMAHEPAGSDFISVDEPQISRKQNVTGQVVRERDGQQIFDQRMPREVHELMQIENMSGPEMAGPGSYLDLFA